jgi:hypothetical protein
MAEGVALKVKSRGRRGVMGVFLLAGVLAAGAVLFPASSPLAKTVSSPSSGATLAKRAKAWARLTPAVAGDARADDPGNDASPSRGLESNATRTGKARGSSSSSAAPRCEADPEHQPRMSVAEKALVLKYVTGTFPGAAWSDGTCRYLEWGGGGSTSMFGTRAGLVHTVEHAPAWCALIERWNETQCLRQRDRWELYCHDSGTPLRKWGYPASSSEPNAEVPRESERAFDDAFAEAMRAYVQAPGRDQFTRRTTYYDVALIDGRLRNACAHAILPYLRNTSIVLWHDFGTDAWNDVRDGKTKGKRHARDVSGEPLRRGHRRYSKTARLLFDPLERAETLAAFRVKRTLTRTMRWQE